MASPELSQLEHELDRAAAHFAMEGRQRIQLSEADRAQSVSVSEGRVVEAAVLALQTGSREAVGRVLAESAGRSLTHGADEGQWTAFLIRIRAQVLDPSEETGRSEPVESSGASEPVPVSEPAGAVTAAVLADGADAATGAVVVAGAGVGEVGATAGSGGAAGGSAGNTVDRLVAAIEQADASDTTSPSPAGERGPSGAVALRTGPHHEATATFDVVDPFRRPSPVPDDPADLFAGDPPTPGPNDTRRLARVEVPTTGRGGDPRPAVSWNEIIVDSEHLPAMPPSPGDRRRRVGVATILTAVLLAVGAIGFLANQGTFVGEEAACRGEGCGDTTVARSDSPSSTGGSDGGNRSAAVETTVTTVAADEEESSVSVEEVTSSTETASEEPVTETTADPSEVRATADTAPPADQTTAPVESVPTTQPATTTTTRPATTTTTSPPIGVACPTGQSPASGAVVRVDSGDVLNIRSGPANTNTIVSTLAPDATGVRVYQGTTTGTWVLVGIPGETASSAGGCGWVHTSYLSVT